MSTLKFDFLLVLVIIHHNKISFACYIPVSSYSCSGGASFYFGQKSSKTSQAPLPTTTQQLTTTLTQTPTVTITQKTVTGGWVLVFSAYTLTTPSDWNSTRDQGQSMDTITLTKGEYKILISQAAGGSGECTYPGEAPAEMSQTFSSFIEITNPNGFVFRRGPTQGSPGTWTVCQNNTIGSSFGFPTGFGNITITAPQTPDTTIMAEVDSILASLKKH